MTIYKIHNFKNKFCVSKGKKNVENPIYQLQNLFYIKHLQLPNENKSVAIWKLKYKE